MRVFQDWVELYGGPEKLAKRLCVTSTAVRSWMRSLGWPKVETIREIIHLSETSPPWRPLTFEEIYQSTKPRQVLSTTVGGKLKKKAKG